MSKPDKDYQYRHIMLDLETLDTSASAVVLSIGAVKFEKDEPGWLGEKFYMVLETEDQLFRGRSTSESTIRWWQNQSESARAIFEVEKTPADVALDKLFDFMGLPGDCKVWGNGAAFDNVILTNLFATYGLEAPWNFWDDRCFRTLKAEFGHLTSKPKFVGTEHHALDDAVHQAKWCQAIYQGLKKGIITAV